MRTVRRAVRKVHRLGAVAVPVCPGAVLSSIVVAALMGKLFALQG
jgi:hypothetical protein